MARTACFVCFISTVNGCSNKKRKEEAYPWKTGASSGHINLFGDFWYLSYYIVELLDRPENIKLARDKRSSLFCTGVSDDERTLFFEN